MEEVKENGPVGLVGIGLVGSALAENLLQAGWKVVGYDPDIERLRRFEAAGGIPARNNAEVGDRAERVILSLMTSEIVHQAVFGPSGLLSDRPAVRCILDTTTCEPKSSTENWSILRERGVDYLDAPISGPSAQIKQRGGTFLIGGDEDVYRKNVDLITTLSRTHRYLGGAGSGTKAKLAVNLIMGVNRLALAEGLLFAQGLGLDLERFLSLLPSTAAYSRVVDLKGEKMVRRDFSTEGKVAQHHKDLTIILAIAREKGLPVPLAATHARVLESLIEAGDGDLDNSAVIQGLEQLDGGGFR